MVAPEYSSLYLKPVSRFAAGRVDLERSLRVILYLYCISVFKVAINQHINAARLLTQYLGSQAWLCKGIASFLTTPQFRSRS